MKPDEILARLGFTPTELAAGDLLVSTPIDGTRIAALRTHTKHAVERAIADATVAFATWRTVPAPRRGELVRLLGEELRAAKADLGASYSLPLGDDKRQLRFFGYVENLFDREYFESGFRTPGRTGRAGASLIF